MASELHTQPPPHPTYLLTYPVPHVLLITINRAKAMNSLTYASHWEGDALLEWFDSEPSLRVAIITGAGKVFCAGQDLIEMGQLHIRQQQKNKGVAGVEAPDRRVARHPPTGFMGVSRRAGKKPVIAAVNGPALGGGFEICLGCDIIVASPRASFALPEASRGVYAAMGGLSRLVRLAGMTIASEVALTGRSLSAEEAVKYGIANRVSKTHESVVDEAVAMAAVIASYSPDAIHVTRAGLRQSWEDGSVERASQTLDDMYKQKILACENFEIGMAAFAKKAKPNWVPSKL